MTKLFYVEKILEGNLFPLAPLSYAYWMWNQSHSKVKFTLEDAMKAQRGSRGIALLFL
jgi:hypothetical protein